MTTRQWVATWSSRPVLVKSNWSSTGNTHLKCVIKSIVQRAANVVLRHARTSRSSPRAATTTVSSFIVSSRSATCLQFLSACSYWSIRTSWFKAVIQLAPAVEGQASTGSVCTWNDLWLVFLECNFIQRRWNPSRTTIRWCGCVDIRLLRHLSIEILKVSLPWQILDQTQTASIGKLHLHNV